MYFVSFNTDKEGLGLCNFTDDQKVRMCLVAVSNFRYEFQFLPYRANLEPTCELKEFSFKYYYAANFWYTGWVIGCKARHLEYGNHTTFYISSGHERCQLFLHVPGEGNHIENFKEFYSYLGCLNTRDEEDT